MTLLHPMALVALPLAATPVVIYLLLRRRKTEIAWGAGYLLRLALASRKRSSRWRQFVVLAVRCLILALAALLLTQPFRPSAKARADTPALPAQPVHRVVLYDNSRSMTVVEDGLARLDRARAAARALLRSQREGDVLDLIPLVPETGGKLAPINLQDHLDDDHIEHALAAIPARDGQLTIEPALAAAMSRLATTTGSAREIYLFTDFPRELESQAQRIGWFAPLARERSVRLTPVSMVGPADTGSDQNVVIDSVTLGTDLLVARVPSRLYVETFNHSDRETNAIIEVACNGPLKQMTVRLNADEHKRLAIPIILPAGESQVLTVGVRPTQLVSQGTRTLSVTVKDALDVWLVADEKDPAAAQTGEPDDLEFFERAIKQRKGQSVGVRLRAARMNELAVPIPPGVDAIILAGPRYTTSAIAKPLGEFVRRGGGLLLTASASLQLPAFNDNLAPLLPAPLDKPLRESVDAESFLQAQVEATPGNAAAPLLEEFISQGSASAGSDFGAARFYNHFRMKDADAVGGVLLRLSNGDPLLVEKKLGRGRVFFYASTLGVGWTSLPVHPSYIPLLTRVLSAAVAGRTLPLNLESGQSFVIPWSGTGSATLTLPDRSTRTVSVLEAASGPFVVLDDVRDGGLYQLAGEPSIRRAFTVADAAREADLRPLTVAATGRLEAALGARVMPDWPTAVKAIGAAGAVRPLWPWFLAAMLGLYVFEAWFVRTV